ncbi:MAG: 5'-deoxynucleotidase YfbR [Chlamydiae bacterium]|nr:5'-deoxynucleotidase YfbR [Chlamydiota bacterium]
MNGEFGGKMSKSLEFLHLAEKLKDVLRHGWTSSGRQESTAEHSWRVSLMVILFHSYLEKPVSLEKALQMAVIHDLCETITGDVPFFNALEGSVEKEQKHIREQASMESIRKLLGGDIGQRVHLLWEEYHAGESEEAKFVRALDKLEAQIQQNEADISTWNEFEKLSIFTYLDKFCNYDGFIKSLKEEVQEESCTKLARADSMNLRKAKTC